MIESAKVTQILRERWLGGNPCERDHRPVTIMPSAARAALGQLLGNQTATWILHQEQVTELKQVIESLMVESHQVLAGYIKPKPDNTYLDQEGITNAGELLTYLSALENEMITRSERKDVIFGGLGNDEAIAAIELANDLQTEIQGACGSREIRDTIIYAFSLINGNPHQPKQHNTLLHFDRHIEIIKGVVDAHISSIRQHKTKNYDDLTGAERTLYRKFLFPSQTREKTPVIATPNTVSLAPLVVRLGVLSSGEPDQSIKEIVGQQFPIEVA